MRTTSRGIVGAALLALTLAACGGTSADSHPTSSSSHPTSSAYAAHITAADIARRAGGASWEQSTEPTIYAEEEGICTVAGAEVTVTTFRDNTARDQWLQVAQSFGGLYGAGDRWVISGDSRSAVEQAVHAAGGEMK